MAHIICDCKDKNYSHFYLGKKCKVCKSIIDIERKRKENNMYFSIMLGVLIITTDIQVGGVKMNEIQAYEFVGKGKDYGGIFIKHLRITLKGDKEDLVYHCKDNDSWFEAIEWWNKNIVNIVGEMKKVDAVEAHKHAGF
jgi:hypothetical protein